VYRYFATDKGMVLKRHREGGVVGNSGDKYVYKVMKCIVERLAKFKVTLCTVA
jgi:hypothetical protein